MCEDLQDQTRPVNDGSSLYNFLYITLLHPRQLIIEDAILDTVLLAIIRYLLQFTGADISRLLRLIQALDKLSVPDGPRRLSQKLQLIQILQYLSLLIILPDDTDKYGSLLLLLHAII